MDIETDAFLNAPRLQRFQFHIEESFDVYLFDVKIILNRGESLPVKLLVQKMVNAQPFIG
ncbi:hypothetical protein D3C84_1251990 [compost metagenome]